MWKIGMIGAGGIATLHAKGLARIDTAKLMGVADTNRSKAETLAARYGAEAFDDYRALLAADIDVVYICTPPFLHKEQGIAAATAGKHIFCEKPITASLEDAKALMASVDAAGVQLTVGYVFHFWPVRAWFRELFESGQLGELVTVWSTRIVGHDWRRDDWLEIPEQSGALTGEFYGHDLEWMCGIGGTPQTVYGRTLTVHPQLKSEDNVQCLLTFQQGLGTGGASWSPVNSSIDTFGILGTRGSVHMEGSGLIRLKLASGEEQTIQADNGRGSAIVPALLPTSPSIPTDERVAWALEQESRAFLDCLKRGTTPAVTGAAAYEALEVALTIRQSAQEGRVIPMGTVPTP